MTRTLSLIDPDPVERRRLQSVLAAEAETVAAFENVETFLAQAGALDSGGLVASAGHWFSSIILQLIDF
jgi:FixJ family two-component response regulator